MTNPDWNSVRRILVIRLRSIGDTVLATPSLIALRRFLPDAQIDILLEDWVAPLLENFDGVDNVISVESGRRLKAARQIRRNKYDVVFNLHGGTTSTFLTRATGAPHRVGFADYQYSFLLNHRVPPATEFWHADHTHSAEQQLALLGYLGIPVDDRPKSHLVVSDKSLKSLEQKLTAETQRRGAPTDSSFPIHNSQFTIYNSQFALLHPSTGFFTKQWPVGNFARVAEFLAERGIASVAIASKDESQILGELEASSKVPVVTFDDLTLPEITALASKAALFVGNDSGIAHIAAAVNSPSVVIFGSSNRNHWRPWTDAPNEIVFEPFPCQPCPGYECKEFGEPKCILSVRPESVFEAIERVLHVVKSRHE
jgi:ADP-heptose:LPS heptosyltransferase